MTRKPVVVFLAFANDRSEAGAYLRNLPEEKRQLLKALTDAENAGHCELIIRTNVTPDEIFEVFQNARYRNRIAVFHFGGHARDIGILVETSVGRPQLAHGTGLTEFLGNQQDLGLVFLNGCATAGMARGLISAGVSATITTSENIDDNVATAFAAGFYRSLASGATIHTAYSEAQAIVHTRLGNNMIGAYKHDVAAPPEWPWRLNVARGRKKHVNSWTLARAAGDVLFGIPLPEVVDLPESPFKHLEPFEKKDTALFFGRDHEIREIYEELTRSGGDPVVLVCGATGVGKSSLLDAGLRPRLEVTNEVVYRPRDAEIGLAQTLIEALGAGDVALDEYWRRREEELNKPLIVILDQVEEVYTRRRRRDDDLMELVRLVRGVFSDRKDRPRGRLLLSFRKEWLAEVEAALKAEKLPRIVIVIGHLSRDGIIDVVNGPVSTERLRHKYKLEIGLGLPERIADDLLRDDIEDATIAPALQILLTRMWRRQLNDYSKQFTVELYVDLARHGILLKDFVNDQIEQLKNLDPLLVESGLLLDLLAYHTTRAGTAEIWKVKDVVTRYGGRPDVIRLIQRCKDRYLLSGTARVREGRLEPIPSDVNDLGTTRLAHDTLAPIVRWLFERSNLPGQRAVRILEQRAIDWRGGKVGPALGKHDLQLVLDGETGMRACNADEERLIYASLRHQRHQTWLRRVYWSLFALAITAIILSTVVAWQRTREAENRELIAKASALLATGETTFGNLLILEAENPGDVAVAQVVLHDALAAYLDHPVLLQGHEGGIASVAFSPNGSRVVTSSQDGTARVWEADTGKELLTLRGHTKMVVDAEYSLDGTLIVTASVDHTARVWDAAKGNAVVVLDGHDAAVHDATFDPSSLRVVTASSDHTVRIWNAQTGTSIRVLRGHRGSVDTVNYSADGTRILTGSSDGTARIWNAATGAVLGRFDWHPEYYNHGPVLSPDSSMIATIEDDTVSVWDIESGKRIGTMQHELAINRLSFNSEGSLIVTASEDETAKVWRVQSSSELYTYPTSSSVLFSSFCHEDSKIIAATEDADWIMWNLGEQTMVHRVVAEANMPWVISHNLNCSRLAIAAFDDELMRVWTTEVGPEIHMREVSLADRFEAVSPDGRYVLDFAPSTQDIWSIVDTSSNKVVALEGYESGGFHDISLGDAYFTSSGKRLVTLGRYGFPLDLWDSETGVPVARLAGHEDESISFLLVSEDGDTIFGSTYGGLVRTWDGSTGAELAFNIKTGHPDLITDMMIVLNGTRLVTRTETEVRLWKVEDGMNLGIFNALGMLLNPIADHLLISFNKTVAGLLIYDQEEL